jgi:hypothetical protein
LYSFITNKLDSNHFGNGVILEDLCSLGYKINWGPKYPFVSYDNGRVFD